MSGKFPLNPFRSWDKWKKYNTARQSTPKLCTGRTAHRGSRGIALPFHDHGTRRGWGISVTPPPLFTPRKDPVPIVQEAGWARGRVWTGAENLTPHRDSIREPSSPYAVTIPTTLPGPQTVYRWQYNTEHVQFMLDNEGYKRIPRIINTYCFSTATTVRRTGFRVTLYVQCLSC